MGIANRSVGVNHPRRDSPFLVRSYPEHHASPVNYYCFNKSPAHNYHGNCAGAITVHSPGLCAQLLYTGMTQRVDLPAGKDKEADKVSKPTCF